MSLQELQPVSDRLYEALTTEDDSRRLELAFMAIEALAAHAAGLEARIAHLEATRPAEVDPLRLLDLSEFARRAGFARATVGKMRDTLPIIDLPSGKGTLPFIREVDAIQWLEDHKRKVTL